MSQSLYPYVRARSEWLRVVLCIFCAISLLIPVLASKGHAATADMDGDGHAADDCAPLDPSVSPGAVDRPDLSFRDTNCDGIDGDREGAFFVAPGGNDANPGTSLQPFATIEKGISEAKTAGKQVYIAVGSYGDLMMSGTSFTGMGIYGGYEQGPWSRTMTLATTIAGSPQAVYVDAATDVLLQMVTLSGTRGASTSAYGLRAVNGAEVGLSKVSVSAGAGRDGTSFDGSQPSAPPPAAGGSAGTCDAAGVGANNITTPAGFTYRGGAGGAGGEETNDGENGTAGSPGQGPAAGGGGPAGIDLAGDDPANLPNRSGKTGGTGGAGAPGPIGANATGDLVFAGVTWAGGNGTAGITGSPGSGGGGGGGGAGRGNFSDWAAGGGGGQGGVGGRGGTGGSGGGWGGGSFGVYLHNAQVSVAGASSITSSNGGNGGNGGAGGAGGPGGAGGAGGPPGSPLACGTTAGTGGAGGPGGAGGAGGDGGGGTGGSSAAVLRGGSAVAVVSPDSVLTAGSGGTGGSLGGDGVSFAHNGQAGDYLGAGGAGIVDFDGDSIADSSDACPHVPRGSADSNGDGCPEGPQTSLISGPTSGSFILSNRASFGFTSTEASTFTCQLDAGAGSACVPARTVIGLSQATHTFRVWSEDGGGEADPSAATRTFTVPRNNTTLAHSRGWAKKKASGYYLNTFSQTTKKGASLSKRVSGVKKIALVATKGRGYGTVKVMLGRTVLKKVRLAASKTQKKRLISIASFSSGKSGTIKVVVITGGKTVRIEGLGIATG